MRPPPDSDAWPRLCAVLPADQDRQTQSCRHWPDGTQSSAVTSQNVVPKILYLATEDWFFYRHFLPMGRAATAAGFNITVAARPSAAVERIVAEGFKFVECDNDRASIRPLEVLRSIARMASIVRAEKPDIVHCISIRTALLGGVAARLTGARVTVLAPTGLGDLWLRQGVAVRLARAVTRLVLGRLFRRPGTHYLFENPDDPLEFGLNTADLDVTIVNGPGVDPAEFAESAEPPGPTLKVAIVARMLKPKGIAEAVAATLEARSRGVPVELHLFGLPDPSNRLSFTEDDLKDWGKHGGIHWHGQTTDAAGVYREHHVAMLLSYREGLPRALVEAAAIGRPIIATDVAGCREVVRDGIEGFLVKPGDIESVRLALARLAEDAELRARMGRAARNRFEERFTEASVRSTITELYQRLLHKHAF